MSQNTTASIAFDPTAPAAERFEAQAELQKAAVDPSSLIPQDNMRAIIDHIMRASDEQELMKSNVVVPFPSKNSGKKGMQSVVIDDLNYSITGEYIERPGMMNFDTLRAMVDQTPVLSAVVMTRVRQMQAFCKVQESGFGPGFVIRHANVSHKLSDEERKTTELLQRFFSNCGWEFNPRERKRMGRQSLRQFMALSVRDSLSMDSTPIETEFKRNKALGLDGFYAVDGATIRLCSEEGYKGDDEVFALQVVQGHIRTAYDYTGLIYEPRNPRTDVMTSGYGISETELLIKVVTGFLNAMTLNIRGFSDNSIPKGVLHLSGNYSESDLASFKRFWNGMVKGVNNAWSVPVLVSKDQESKASFENFGVEFNEMMFGKWMTFLTSIICAIYGMSPNEINFDSFSGGNTSTLGGSDTAEKLAMSKDSGLRPLLSYYENLFSDYVLAEMGDSYVFRWTGVDEDDQDKRHELKKMVMSVNEMRAELGLESQSASWGEAPLNPSLIGPWSQEQAAAQQPGPDMQSAEQAPGFGGDQDGPENGPDDPKDEPDQPDDGGPDGGDDQGGNEPVPPEKAEPMQKAIPQAMLLDAAKRGQPEDEEPKPHPASHGVGINDEVFFHHPKHGASSGKVLAYGADGFTAEHSSGRVGVPWESFLGHKTRAERTLTQVESGEGGSIVKDEVTGRQHFLAGNPAEYDGEDPEYDEERSLILGDDKPVEPKPKAEKPLAKSEPVVVNLPAAQDLTPALLELHKSIADSTKAMSAALADQSARIDAVADASLQSAESRRSELMTKAIVEAIAEERKPIEINLKLEMPDQKPVSKTIRRNPDGTMTVEG